MDAVPHICTPRDSFPACVTLLPPQPHPPTFSTTPCTPPCRPLLPLAKPSSDERPGNPPCATDRSKEPVTSLVATHDSNLSLQRPQDQSLAPYLLPWLALSTHCPSTSYFLSRQWLRLELCHSDDHVAITTGVPGEKTIIHCKSFRAFPGLLPSCLARGCHLVGKLRVFLGAGLKFQGFPQVRKWQGRSILPDTDSQHHPLTHMDCVMGLTHIQACACPQTHPVPPLKSHSPVTHNSKHSASLPPKWYSYPTQPWPTNKCAVAHKLVYTPGHPPH